MNNACQTKELYCKTPVVASMPIDKEKLKVALSTFQKTEEGYICPSELVKLWSNVHLNTIAGVKLPSINRPLQYIYQDVNNLETISSRLVWELDLSDRNELNPWNWMRFAEVDIAVFHIELRSIFDYSARIIQEVSDLHKPIKKCKSFTKLKNWLVNEEGEKNMKTLGDDLAKLVLSARWFDEIKDVRDEIMHKGAEPMVFPEKGRILFQVSRGAMNLISFPEVKFNENVIDFELYAGVYFGYLIAFLEEASKVVEKRLPPRKSAYGSANPRKVYGKQLPAIYSWIEKVLEKA